MSWVISTEAWNNKHPAYFRSPKRCRYLFNPSIWKAQNVWKRVAKTDRWMDGGMDGWKPLLFAENVQKDSSIQVIRSSSVSFCDYQHFVMFNIWYINVTTQWRTIGSNNLVPWPHTELWVVEWFNHEGLKSGRQNVGQRYPTFGAHVWATPKEYHKHESTKLFFLFHTLFAHYFLATPLQRFCSSSPFHCHVTMMNPSWTLNRQLSLPDSMPAILKVWPLLLGPQVWKHLCRLDHRGHSLSLFHHHLVALRHTRGIKACICCRLKCKRKVQGAPGSTREHPVSIQIYSHLYWPQSHARWFDSHLLQLPSKGVESFFVWSFLADVLLRAPCKNAGSPVDHTSVSTNHAITDTYQPPKCVTQNHQNSVGRVPQWLDDYPSHPNLQKASTQIHNWGPIGQCLGGDFAANGWIPGKYPAWLCQKSDWKYGHF